MPEEVAQRGLELVRRIARILQRRGAMFRDKTTDEDWAIKEETLGLKLNIALLRIDIPDFCFAILSCAT